MSKKKFDSLFDKTDEKIADNGTIDFEKSDIDHIPPKKSKKVKEKRTVRVQGYLTKSEMEEWSLTFAPFEKMSDRIRNLVLEDIKKRKEQ